MSSSQACPKRALSSSTRAISPPALRRKLTQTSERVVISTRPPCATGNADADLFRVFSWNVNGIGPLLQKQLIFESSTVSPLRLFLQRHRWPQVLCLQEVKIKSTDTATRGALIRAANGGNAPGEPTYTAHFSLPRDSYNATAFGGKIHGVATLVRDDTATAIRVTRRPEWDLEGRVLIHELENHLVIINGYWVNGTSRPYRDPVGGHVSGTRHDHKLRFHQWMLEETLRLEAAGQCVILIGDMNIARSEIDGHPRLRTAPSQHVKNRADFNAKFFTAIGGMRGVDIFRHLHGEEKKYTYYPRGKVWGESCDRVDLIVLSRSLVEADLVASTDIFNSPVERGHSDHVPLCIALDIDLRGTLTPRCIPKTSNLS
ncbi:uncharacterized protein A1O9_06659 [Exophiala aquamarina CBS 119918]|uniref:Endonuclease/exonuclease/phosphatase domain-containing protein n=1 Tax=Exophiala aquamarina CBS 119918 TaxID=1182545 RepID=A0A072PHF7_9EURO|nr:uncharacterized protein A1O9_06659 [Exophiala aquamarina CBS 119918]KEF58733.1 hypothetical protein A1O9_06659 [Exophiala aquamarina CBS 119918]